MVGLFEIKYLKNKNPKFRNIYEVQFKNRVSLSLFFLQGYSEMKIKLRNNRGVLEEFKSK